MKAFAVTFKRLAVFAFVLLLAATFPGCTDGYGGAELVIGGETAVFHPGKDDSVVLYLPELTADSEESGGTESDDAPEDVEYPDDTEDTTEDTSTADTTKVETDEAADIDRNDDGVVYWVKSGEVWHTDRDCPTLARSKEIFHGSVEDAISTGKSRVCMRCP